MNITVNARHMHVTDSLNEYARSKAEKLNKYYNGITSIDVIMDPDHGHGKVEMVVQASRKSTFVAHAESNDLYAGVDRCVDKLSQQIRKHKEKVRDRHHPSPKL